jgi:methyl-accepting chemotaxis protein WspA
MLNNLGIKHKLMLGFGAMVAIILVLLGVAYQNFARLSEASNWDRHTLQVMLEMSKVPEAALQIQSATRGYLLTGNDTLLAPIATEQETAKLHIAKTQALTADNPTQQERLKRLAPMFDSWIKTVVEPLIAKRREINKAAGATMQSSTITELLSGAQLMADMRKLIDDVSGDEERLLALRTAESAQLQKSMSLVLTIGGLVCAVLAAGIGMALARTLLNPLNQLTETVSQIAGGNAGARAKVLSGDELGEVATSFNHMAQTIQDNQEREAAATNALREKVDVLLAIVSRAASGDLTGVVSVKGEDAVGRLGSGLQTMVDNLRQLIDNVQKAGIQVTTSATEIAASAKQQEATGIEQAQTSVEILSTTKEISANTTQLLRTMEEASSVADYTTAATAEAQTNLKRMDVTMQRMVSATDSINAKLAALSEKASNINSVLTTITKVADQTNILSLNAAIEAEKAGEAGRGFSVVATEIRRLADQTSVSTWDIEQMLGEMQSAVSASVMGMDKFSEEIRRSVEEVSKVGEQLSSMMDQVQKLTPQFDMVLAGMQSQAVGAGQITDTMMQLSDATQQTVDSLKATSEAVHQLQYAAGDLQASVANFSVGR